MSRLKQTIERDVDRGLYDGAVTIVAIGGEVVFRESIGYADRASGKALREDSIFPLFSVSKPMTAVSFLQRVERGEVRLDSPVCEVIPEFAARGKQRITFGQLLSHTAGLSGAFPPVAPADIGNLAVVVPVVCDSVLVTVPGEATSYSPIMAHAVIAEAVRRLDGGDLRFREIVSRDLLDPLGMTDTWLGMRSDLAGRAIVPSSADDSKGLFDGAALVGLANAILDPANDYEIPSGGFVSTAADVFKFGEALRQGGALDGARVLSPAMVAFATIPHTGSMSNNLWEYARESRGWPAFPANLGLGFFIRGHGMIPTWCGHLASPEAYGAMGAGSTNFWVDPTRGMTMVCLTTGLLEESNSGSRFQRLSDVAIAEFYR